MKGKVYLVGAGPGNPDLLTVQAVNVLKKSDVILYDRLVGRSILKSLRTRARKIYVGERHGHAVQRQERTFALIKKYSARGFTVARLQNGDPFLFGRGGEEIQFLEREGLPYEVIPGITSAIGVPSSVGVPLTERSTSSALMVVPGHSMEGNHPNWKEVAAFRGTVVILMGAARIKELCDGLVSNGKDPSTPACMIERGTRPGRRVVAGTLGELGSLAAQRRISAPAVTVIGETVKLAKFYRSRRVKP